MAQEDPGIPTATAPVAIVAGKYRLSRLLGRGGMGSVWEAVHQTLGTRVAVKFIDAEHVESDEARRRFENEARAAATLRSKHVVEVYDHGVTEDGRPFIVMEFLDGEPLDKRLDRVGRLSPKESARLIAMVCRALAKAHAAGIVHRDLKPDNIFLVWDDEDGADVAKVVDFGIAKFTDSQGSISATRTGSVLGTPYYMSPEQARGLRAVDYRSDLWSVGVIAFRCVTGHLPFEGEAVGDVLVKLCTAEIPVPSTLASDLPPGFDAWFARALARDPSARFQSAADLSTSLWAVCGLSMQTPLSGEGLRVSDFGSGPHPAPALTPFNVTTPSAQVVSEVARAPQITGAPSTRTPPPVAPGARSRRGALVAVAGVALVVVGIGVGVMANVLGADGAAPAHDPRTSELKPASLPTVAPPLPPSTAKPQPVEPLGAVAAPSTVPAVSAALPKSRVPVTKRPTVRPTPQSKTDATAKRPVTKPDQDMGF